MGSGGAKAGRKGLAAGAGGCWRALAERGWEEGADEELSPGERYQKGAGGGCWPAEVPQGVGRVEGHMWGVFFERERVRTV
jgi:hypothetical protein